MGFLYFSSNVTGVTTSRRMKRAGYAARMTQIGDSQKVLVPWIWYINEIK
jgi:hypothetical protein